MFRPHTSDDVTDEEYEKYVSPHRDAFDQFMVEFIMPEASAFYIYSAYHLFPDEQYDLSTYVNSSLDVFNVFDENLNVPNFDRIVEKTKEILFLKYGLEIISESPLNFKWRGGNNV